MGMSPDVLAKAIDPFFTTKPAGAGNRPGAFDDLRLRQAKPRSFAHREPDRARHDRRTLYCRARCKMPSTLTHPVLLPRRADAVKPSLSWKTIPTVRLIISDVLEELGYAGSVAVGCARGHSAAAIRTERSTCWCPMWCCLTSTAGSSRKSPERATRSQGAFRQRLRRECAPSRRLPRAQGWTC